MPLKPLTQGGNAVAAKVVATPTADVAVATPAVEPKITKRADHYDTQGAGKVEPAPIRSIDLLPFAKGSSGGLSPAVDFKRFMALPDPTEANVREQVPMLLDYVKTARFGQFTGQGGVAIRYAVFDPPPGVPVKGVINLVTGRGESFVKYAETLFNLRDLRAQGYVIATMDHRGQGFSGRELADPQKDYVHDFEDFIRDEHRFTNILKEHFGSDVPRTLLAHSMGGAISTRYLEEHPGEYSKAILCSPMLNIRTGYADPLEDVIADVAGTLMPEHYAAQQHPYQRGPFEKSLTTNSRARHEVDQAITDAFPDTAMGGATWGWIKQNVNATRALMRSSALDALKGVDVHMLRATDDRLVETGTQDAFAEHVGIVPKGYWYTDAAGQKHGTMHELFSQSDDVRVPFLNDVRALITS